MSKGAPTFPPHASTSSALRTLGIKSGPHISSRRAPLDNAQQPALAFAHHNLAKDGPRELIGEDLSVTHPTWGNIYVRNKRPASQDSFTPDRIVVMQHGTTYDSAAFDLPFAGIS